MGIDATLSEQVLHQPEVGWECPECHLKRGVDGHDPCLGELPGVKYACCGHGRKGNSGGYIFFENGKIIRFERLTEIYDHDKFWGALNVGK